MATEQVGLQFSQCTRYQLSHRIMEPDIEPRKNTARYVENIERCIEIYHAIRPIATKVTLGGLKRFMSRGNSLSDELELGSVLGDTRAYLYSPVWG